MRAVTANVTVANPQAFVRLDNWWGAALAVQSVPSNGAQYTVDYSFDDPNDLVNPVPLASAFWDTSMVRPSAIASLTGATFAMPVSPLWMRLRLLNGVGAARATFVQHGVHSRSNIGSGAFAPRLEEDIIPEGENYQAMNGRRP